MFTRLAIAVLFVAAVAVNTATAQATNTTTPSATTAASSSSSSSNVTSSSNTTTPSATTAASSSSSSSNVTSSSNTTTPSATIASSSPSSNGTTSSNTTTPSATTAASSNSTTAFNTTTTSATTAALNPVGALTTSISKVGCGTQQLCLSQPASCDPSISGSCYFISSQLLSGQTYQLGLSGDSTGYIATALSTDGTVGNGNIAFVCANNNGTVQFFTANLIGTTLQKTNLAVDSVKGTVSGTKLQCLFNATLPAGSTKALNVQVLFLNGTYNTTTGGLGNANTIFQRSTDLSNPSSHGITFKQSLMHAMLVVVVALGLTMQ